MSQGGRRDGVKNDQKIKVLSMGWPIVENVPASCGIILNLFGSPQLNPRKKIKKSVHFYITSRFSVFSRVFSIRHFATLE